MACKLPGNTTVSGKSILRRCAVMLVSLLASFYLLHSLTQLGGSALRSPVSASVSASELVDASEAPLRRKRVLHRWVVGSVARQRFDGADDALGPQVRDAALGFPSASGKLRPLGDGTKRLPQAIIVGVKKGGTRALLEFLRVHPDVRAAGAEPHFFDRFYDNGLEWYRDLMPKTLEGQITMEKTPSYFVTREAPARIYSMSRSTKLIVVVRDPVTRAISDYTQTLSKKPDIPSFESLTFKNRTTGLIDTSWSAIQIGIYAKHLDNWLQFFPMRQILFVSGERLISDPAGELGRVQDFLGLKRIITDKHFYFNETKGFPCLKKAEGSSKPHCLGKTKGRTHPNIDPEVVQRLRDFYRPFNMKFYQMTGRIFGWDD
ncbi:hypothetical protein PGIGA_G00040020 [Pangasianodon gigas]|uniref:Uncharacterized protein n=1 Tax=Pangasianodon gigas TaxID=30993 RepID=A0ACC5WZX0_PANGG|nr:hypothetical protein [Pangasianodon gigas]